MNKQSVELPQSLPGNFVLLHSGYGGGQYVGRVIDVMPTYIERYLSMLVFDPETMRYQPISSVSASTARGHNHIYHWQHLSLERHNLPLKEKDRLYLVGDSADLSFFEKSREPINPENPEHVKRLTGKESLELLYGGSELLMVR